MEPRLYLRFNGCFQVNPGNPFSFLPLLFQKRTFGHTLFMGPMNFCHPTNHVKALKETQRRDCNQWPPDRRGTGAFVLASNASTFDTTHTHTPYYIPSVGGHANQRNFGRCADETADCTGCHSHYGLRSKVRWLPISTTAGQK